MDEVLTFSHHTESVRSIDFSPAGNILYAASKDKSFSVYSNGLMQGRLENAHSESINKIIHLEDEHIVATGDDDGVIKIWDLRMAQSGKDKSCAMSLTEHEGSISDMKYVVEDKKLLSSSNDGMLGVWDLRKQELYAMSDSFDIDQNALVILKNGKKVLTAAADGIINIFSWDWFGDCTDRIVGHPDSIECMVKYDENTVITGGEDGLIRAVSVLPNRILAILGDPLDTEDEIFNI
jgi:WD repeat-containing protein 55